MGGKNHHRGPVHTIVRVASDAATALRRSLERRYACPQCGLEYVGDLEACPLDGSALEGGPDPLTGIALDERFILGERLGERAGVGPMYRLVDETSNATDLAAVLVHPELAADPSYRAAFLARAEASRGIVHEHVARVTHVIDRAPLLVAILRDVRGEPLSKLLSRGPIEDATFSAIALGVAGGLTRAHNEGICHGHLGPDDVFVLRHPRRLEVRVIGFETPEPRHLCYRAIGAALAPRLDEAPEQIRGRAANVTSDVHGIGRLLFEMITGRRPYDACALHELALIVLRAPAPRIDESTPLARAVAPIVARAMAPDPRDRYATIADLLFELVPQLTTCWSNCVRGES